MTAASRPPDRFPYSPHATDEETKRQERDLYRLLNPTGQKDGYEWRVLGWVQMDVRLLK